jgi:hypothetical protein
MKFVIVMTDGQNTQQYDLRDHHKYGMSDVWIDDNGTASSHDDVYSVRVDANTFFWPHEYYESRAYRSGPYSRVLGGAAEVSGDVVEDAELARRLGLTVPELQPLPEGSDPAANGNDGICGDDAADYGGGRCAKRVPRQLSNAELNGRIRTPARANNWYWRMYRDGRISYNTYRTAYYAWETRVDADQADARLSSVCGAARGEGVVIYAIGVEAPSRGLQAMRDCASSPAHYFDVEGEDLEETFNAIATVMTQLRLTL